MMSEIAVSSGMCAASCTFIRGAARSNARRPRCLSPLEPPSSFADLHCLSMAYISPLLTSPELRSFFPCFIRGWRRWGSCSVSYRSCTDPCTIGGCSRQGPGNLGISCADAASSCCGRWKRQIMKYGLLPTDSPGLTEQCYAVGVAQHVSISVGLPIATSSPFGPIVVVVMASDGYYPEF